MRAAANLTKRAEHCIENPMPPQQIVDIQLLGLCNRNWPLDDSKHPIALKHGATVMRVVQRRVQQMRAQNNNEPPGLQVFLAFLSAYTSLSECTRTVLEQISKLLCKSGEKHSIVSATTAKSARKIVAKIGSGNSDALIEFFVAKEPQSSPLCGMWRTISLSIL